MALPTMPTSRTTNKNVFEAAIVRRREMEAKQYHDFGSYDRHVQRETVRALKENGWTSEQSFKHSMASYFSQQERERKRELLVQRRIRLGQLLAAERNQLEKELHSIGKKELLEREDDMRSRVEQIRSARTDRDQAAAREKLLQHIRQNNPELREIESKQHQKYVANQWPLQLKEKDEAREREIELDAEFQKLEAERAVSAAEEARAARARREEAERNRQQALLDQIETMRFKEAESERLKGEERKLLEQQAELERLDAERTRLADERRKREHGRVLLRQHAASLRRRAQLVQEELAQDRDFMEAIAAREKDEVTKASARRERARADAHWMQQVLEQQMQLERQREAELDILFKEESARLWEKREEEWRREREAREALMQQVIHDRRQQIDEKLSALRQRQLDALKEREEILQEVETAREIEKSARQKHREERETRKQEMEAQMAARAAETAREAEAGALDVAAEDEERRAYEQFLEQERKRLERIPFQPKVHSRPKSAW